MCVAYTKCFRADLFEYTIDFPLSDSLLVRPECGCLVLPVITSLNNECMLVANRATSMWEGEKAQYILTMKLLGEVFS